MFRTLFARLSGALVAVSLLLSLALVLLLQSTHQSFHLEIDQKLHQQLAERLAARIGDGGEKAIEDTFAQVRELAILNPAIAAYALDARGSIVRASVPAAEVKRSRVSLEPILAFIQGPKAWPLLGDDPARERGEAVFSAAQLPPAAGDGYLYVVLDIAPSAGPGLRALERSYSLREALWLILLNVAAALVAALIAVGLITRPVRRLRHAMEAFDESQFAGGARYQARPGRAIRDEIDRLGKIFDSMADRIAMQIESLRRSDEGRRDLYANISHDLQTPLTALRGYVETLRMKDASLAAAERRQYLDILYRQTIELGELVEQVIDLARLETPELRLQLQETHIDELLQHVVVDARPVADEKRLNVSVSARADRPLLKADPGLLRRALANILLNAIQASAAGGSVEVRLGTTGTGDIEIAVADSGPGIRTEELQRVFNRHYRGSKPPSAGSPGMGLGLAIARKVIELHGGTLLAGNVPGGGAVMTVTLPSARS